MKVWENSCGIDQLIGLKCRGEKKEIQKKVLSVSHKSSCRNAMLELWEKLPTTTKYIQTND